MKKLLVTIGVSLWACLSPLSMQSAHYVWDNGGGTGIWNEAANWGLTNTPNYNVEPSAADGAIFLKNVSPVGTVRLNADGFAQYIRFDASRSKRIISIHSGQVVDRTLTLSGNGPALIDGWETWVDVTLDGTPNGNGARLRLQINGSGTSLGTRINKATTMRISCPISGAGGFILNGGLDGPGRLMLSEGNAYTGPTTINNGIVLVNGSTAAGSVVTVNNGGVLAGAGTIGGPVTVNPGGLVAPGINSHAALIDTLTVNNDFTLAGDLQIEVNKSLAQSNDTLMVSGVLTNAGAGFIQLLNYGPALAAGDRFQIFNQPLANGGTVTVVSGGREVWTNKLAVDGSIEVLAATNTPVTGNPTTVYTWKGAQTSGGAWRVPMSLGANWTGNQSPAPNSSNVFIFDGDLLVPYQWPFVDTNYGTSILIFSNNTALNSIKILAGSNNTVNLGSFVRQDSAQPCYFGITEPVPIKGADNNWYDVKCDYFTNALGDASCGSQTDFQCIGGWLAVYGVLRDGAGTSSRLVKSGNATLNITGYEPNTYTGGTIINAGPIKMSKPQGVDAIPGDVIVNGSGSLDYEKLENKIYVGDQVADTARITLNDAGRFQMSNRPETIQTVESLSSRTAILNITNLTIAPSATGDYNGGMGESIFLGTTGSTVPSGTLRMNGTGSYGMLGVNAVANLVVNSGTLKVNGNSGTGVVTVNAGSTLLGKGTIAGAVTVAGGATLSAGFSVGQLTLAAGLNMSAGGNGATNVWELAAFKDSANGVAGMDFDQIVLAGGTLALGAQSTLDLRFTGSAGEPDANEPFWQSPHSWRIVLLNGGTNPGASNFGRIKSGAHAAGNFTTTANASGILLTFTPDTTRPRITAVAGAGTGSVTVYYTNTMPGINYVLSYNTNLNSPFWFIKSTKTATGASDFQTDNSATTDQRYYQIDYLKP